MKKYKTSLVIGKFYPPHLGHEYLINKAIDISEHVDVVVCDLPSQKIRGNTRASWIQKIFKEKNVQVLSVPDIGKDDDSMAWAKYTKEFLGYIPDVVCTSEDYGDLYAKYLGCEHVKVDKERIQVPISATKIRKDLYNNLNWLNPIVKAELIPKVVVLGAESTGTTILANDLAKEYKTVVALEYGRLYSEGKLFSDLNWNTEEFDFIGNGQNRLESHLAKIANKVLICDTDSFATELWHERYLGYFSTSLKTISETRRASLYILTGDEIPFVQDGTRDGEDIRHNMHKKFIHKLNERGYKYIIVNGNREHRLNVAKKAINDLILNSVFNV